MQKLPTFVLAGCVALAACMGAPPSPQGYEPGAAGSPGSGGNGATSTDGTFACNPNIEALTPSTIRRLAKVYVQNALSEFMSQLSATSQTTLLSSIQTRLDLIPTDGSPFYSVNDSSVTQDHVDALFGLAMAVATNLSDKTTTYPKELLSVCGANLDESALQQDACLTTFVQYYGRKAFRRPLSSSEVDDFKSFYQQAATASVDGIFALVGRLLAHPNFYYRLDSDGNVVSGAPGQNAVYQLTKWELLSKITFLFWAAPPDDTLYQLVDGTDITQDGNLKSFIETVLADPRAEQGLLGLFYREWLALDKTQMPGTDGNVLAAQSLITAAGITSLPATHQEDMIQEVLDLAKHYTLTTEGKLDDILTSQYSFAKTPALAKVYGVAPWDGTPDHLVSLPPGQRSGLLTRAAMVAANTEYTRPIVKGENMRVHVLCIPVPPPPPGLNITPLTHPANLTTRQAVEQATMDPLCMSCHGGMNPLGFLTENYDPLGRFRTKELRFADMTANVVSQLDINTDAVAVLSPSDSKDVPDGVALGAYLAQSGEAHVCMVRNYFEYVNGRQEDDTADGCDLESLHQKLWASGGSIKNMLRDSVMLQSFRERAIQ
jgi:hypothetical protein